jgi:protein phosphatase
MIHRLTRSIIAAVQKLLPSMNIWGAKRDLTKQDVYIRLCEASSETEEVKYIYQEAQKSSSLKEMGTTLVIALIVNKDLIILNIGDSRVYLYSEEKLTQATEDQTYVEYLLRQGKITEEQKINHPQKHVLLNALGLNNTVSYDVKIVPYQHQTILVCSDGLYNNLTEAELTTIIRSSDTPQQKVDSLIHLANANGGTDNIAVAIWEPER